jgi:vacuolar-type H+-ATPase subunit I/STV1
MKLAEALLLRADLQKRVQSISSRLVQGALVQEGVKPAENPKDLLADLNIVLGQLEQTVVRINKANIATKLKDGTTLMEALAHREILKQRHKVLSEVVAASRPAHRYGQAEIRWIPTMEVHVLQKQMDDLAKSLRELNATIQEAGWLTNVD